LGQSGNLSHRAAWTDMLEPTPLDDRSTSAAGSPDRALAEAVDRIGARLRRGESADIERELAQNPEWAEGLRVLLPMLEALAMARPRNPAPANAEQDPRLPADGTPAGDAAGVTPAATLSANASPATNPKSNPGAPGENPKLLGDFELIREVGRGGMGIVYEARQVSLGRRVAVKVLPAASLLDERQLQRFQNEARAAAQLNHPHIVDVICIGCDNGVHYFAMRFVEGQTLAEMSVVRGPSSVATDHGPRTTDKIEWIAQAAEALEYAHNSGVVHRDVKPSNLLVDGEGKLWVTDFGVARFGDDAGLTLTGDLLGTLRYMSPEQALGRLSAIGPRSDVYSLGATLYELLASRPVFDGEDRGELLRQVAFERPAALRTLDPRLPRDLETIAHKALEKSPEDRYASAGEMAADLRRFLRGEPIRAKPPTLGQRAFKWSWRYRRLVASAAAVLVLAFIGLSVGTLLISRSRNESFVARKLVEDRDRENRRMLSAIETRLALQAYQRGELERASELLDRQLPSNRGQGNNLPLPPGAGRGEGGPPTTDVGSRPYSSPHAPREGNHHAERDVYGGQTEDFRDFTWHWLRGAVRARLPLVASFDDYPGEVYSVEYSPDGALMAMATYRKIIVREVPSGAIRYTIEAHKSDVNCARFSPDGTLLASVGDDCHVRLWRASDGEPVADLGTHEPNPVLCVSFSPDGRLLATGGDRGSVRLWSVIDRSEIRRPAHSGRVESVLFADRGTLLVVAADAQMTAWDVETGEARWRAVGQFGPFLSLAVSPNGTTIAAGDHHGAVGLFNAVDGRGLGSFGMRQAKIQTVAFSPDAKLLAAGGHDGVAQVWNVASQTYCGQTSPHRERLWSVAFSPDGRRLATASRDRSIKLWDVASQRQPWREKLDALSFQIAFSGPERTLAFFQDLGMRLWPRGSANSRPMEGRDLDHGYLSPVGWAAGKWFLCRCDSDRRAFDVTDDEVCLVRPDAAIITQLAPSSDGQWLGVKISRGGKESIEIWHVPSKRLRYAYFGRLPVFTTRGEAYFNQYFEGAKGTYGRVTRLKLDDFESHAVEFAPNDQPLTLALSPDDRIMAMGNADSTIETLEIATGSRRRLVGHERAVTTLDFSPDGRTLASGALDGTVRLWRVNVGEPLGILERRNNGEIQQVKFSHDGRSLAAAGQDGDGATVSLWEVK
jgi:eukaryotic-like serine/threonine-protein kinase